MSGLFLSLGWMLFVVLGTAVIFRRWAVTRRFRVMCGLFLIGGLGFIASFALMPPRPEPLAEFLNGLYLYAFFFFGVVAQCYGLADRGFSLAILTDVYRAGRQPRSRAELKQVYAGGRGMAYAREKRIAQLLHGGFIRLDAGAYRGTQLGLSIGRAFGVLQRLYRFQETG